LTLVDLTAALVAVAGAVATLTLAFFAFFAGLDWPALAFASGGIYLSVWAGMRLTSSPRE
jgi:hypothetical protein